MVEDSRQEPVEAERTGRARRARAFVARGLWLFLVLLWLAYGVCVGGVNPALSAVALPPVLAAYYIRYRRTGLTNRTRCPAWWAAYGLLAAIPVGQVLSSAIRMEYVRDYHAYLMLGKSLYADGTYVDYRGEVAWRPPGTSLLYALPSLVGIPDQSGICAINSGVLVIIFLCIKKFIGRDATADLWFAVVPAATVICLATSYLLFLPIAHLPPLALMLFVLVLVPTRARPLADFPPSGWLLVGILTGISSLFRANLVLECRDPPRGARRGERLAPGRSAASENGAGGRDHFRRVCRGRRPLDGAQLVRATSIRSDIDERRVRLLFGERLAQSSRSGDRCGLPLRRTLPGL